MLYTIGAEPNHCPDPNAPLPDYSKLDLNSEFSDLLRAQENPNPKDAQSPIGSVRTFFQNQLKPGGCPPGLVVVCCAVPDYDRPRPAQCAYCMIPGSSFSNDSAVVADQTAGPGLGCLLKIYEYCCSSIKEVRSFSECSYAFRILHITLRW